jgi:predicted ester cyclase
MERVSKEGQLLKKGHLVRSWKPRWHVLLDQSLEYYETQAKSVKKGSIPIDHRTTVKTLSEGEFCFAIQSNESALEMSASSEEERNTWVAAIQGVVCRNQLRILYRDCLTVNLYTTVSDVLSLILPNDYVSYGSEIKSNVGFANQIQQFWKTIPDLKWEVQEMIVEGNKVVVRSIASGSPRGDFMGVVGLDGSKSFHITTIDIHTVEEGRIKSTHHLEDWTTALRQLSTSGYTDFGEAKTNSRSLSAFPSSSRSSLFSLLILFTLTERRSLTWCPLSTPIASP